MDYANIIASQLNLGVRQVEKTIELLEAGATVPFIARYRKEATGNLNEVQIAAIRDLLLKLKEIDKRRTAILQSIEEQGKLTPELRASIEQASTMTDLEDLYLPYKPKRKTRASVAVERGLQPLADALQKQYKCSVEQLAMPFVNEAKGVENVDDALAGARDIIAERVSEDIAARNRVRNIFRRSAMLSSKVVKAKEEEAGKFQSWFDWKENAMRAPSHRILAMFRGEAEGLLRVKIAPEDDEPVLEALERLGDLEVIDAVEGVHNFGKHQRRGQLENGVAHVFGIGAVFVVVQVLDEREHHVLHHRVHPRGGEVVEH